MQDLTTASDHQLLVWLGNAAVTRDECSGHGKTNLNDLRVYAYTEELKSRLLESEELKSRLLESSIPHAVFFGVFNGEGSV